MKADQQMFGTGLEWLGMKGEKTNRRKSTSSGAYKAEITESCQRIVTLPYSQAVVRAKKDRSALMHIELGAKQLIFTEQFRGVADKHKKEQQHGGSAKHRMPRFSSEVTNDRCVVPSLWHKPEEKAKAGSRTKDAMHLKNELKKAKILERSTSRHESHTPQIVKRGLTDKMDLLHPKKSKNP